MKYPPYYKSIKRKYRYKTKRKDKTTIAKDKAWSILSDYVRKRDFKKYGRCVSCGKVMDCWQDLQAGHFVEAGVGGAELSFDEKNVNGQCPFCNHKGSMDTGHRYGIELDRRWGQGTADELYKRRFKTTNADESFFIGKIEEIHDKLQAVDNSHTN